MEYDHDSARLFLCSVSTVWGWLGGDLWLEIFKRLPIKTLCRFQCVCKSYKSFISSPFFVNLHHSVTSSSTPPILKPYLLVNVGVQSQKSSALYLPQESQVLYFPFRSQKDFACVDVVRGVVCVSCSLDSSFDSTILWNPAISKYVSLPRLGYLMGLDPAPEYPLHDYFNSTARFSSSAIGFGYDTSKNDFKVVRFWIHDRYYGTPSPPTYEVYSAGEGLWRAGIIDNTPFFRLDPDKSRSSCFINGTIHWFVSTPVEQGSFDMRYSVLMFDCELEEFETMELPLEIYKADIETMEEYRTAMELEGLIVTNPSAALDYITDVEVLEYGGMLSVLVHRHWGHLFELWVMEENGTMGFSKWEKLFWIHDGEESDGRLSFGNRAPYQTFEHILDGHVYEESMFLMDAKAQSYTKEEIVNY